MLKRKFLKIIIGGFGGLIILIFGFVYLNSKRTDFKLTILTKPENSIIKINGIEEGKGTLTKTLPKGIYKITTELEGYIPDERDLNLESDKSLTIILIKKLGMSTPPDKFKFKSTQSVSVYSPNIINDKTI